MSKLFDKAIKNWSITIALCFFIVSVSYLIIIGDDLYIVVFDNLDSTVAWYKILRDYKLFWTFDTQAPFLGGISRDYLHSDLKLYSFLYMLFPNFVALIIGWYLRIALSMTGFVFLGRTIFGNDKDSNIYLMCGLLHGILPVFPICGLGFASLPFLMFVLIKLYKKWNWKYITFLIFYPLASYFAMFGIFICGYIILFFLIDWIATKRPSIRLLGGMLGLILGYVATEWRLFYTALFSGVETIRTTFSSGFVGWRGAIDTFVNAILLGGYDHVGSSHTIVVLPVCTIFFMWVNYKHIKSRNRLNIIKDPFNWILIWQVLNYVVYSIDNMEWFDSLVSTLVPPLKGFSFARTFWFTPFVWYFAFMIVLCRVTWNRIAKILICMAAFFSICLYPSIYNHILWNSMSTFRRITGEERVIRISGYESDLLSYKEFYSASLFDRIKEDIGYSGEWSVAFGMHPAVLSYNGIATLDGYSNYYPKDYKDQFRKLIKPDLDVDSGHEEYFESFGGRAYIFSKDVPYTPYRTSDVTEADMLIDPEVFRDMGGKYVFSRVSITNTDELGIDLFGIYEEDGSPYTIYVYETR